MAQPPILTMSDISLNFGGDPLFENLSLAVHPGDRIALVGRNGSGKSTLMRIMQGHVVPDSGTVFIQPGQHVAMMEQEPDFSGFATLADWVRAGLHEDEFYRADIALEGVKLEGTIAPGAASGGERRRAALARLLAQDAELMLLDEPTNHLDIEMISWLEQELASTQKAFVLISHDRAFLRALTRNILWVDRGQVRRVDRGFSHFEEWRDKIFEEEDQQRHKLNRLIKAEARWAVEGISARRKRNMGRVRRLADLRAERSSQIRRAGVAAMEFEAAPKSGALVVEARDVSKSFGERCILRDFSMRIQRGERIAFVGPNGAGKTTLLNLLTGALAPDSGTIKLGANLVPAVFDQNRAALDPSQTLWTALTEDPAIGGSGRNDQIMVRGTARHVVGYLKDFLFAEEQMRSPITALSGGEKARLLLARLMAQPANLLILDEPTNDLDVETLDLLQELLDDFDGTVLLVSHDRDFIDRIATTTLVMEGDGKVTICAGGYTDSLAQRAVKAEKPATVKKPANVPATKAPKPAAKPALSFTETHRLAELPAVIAEFEADIAKLTQLLATPDLYANAPAKFAKATAALADRQARLAKAEEEWLLLEERA
ncbi:MAG: ABC-F family ATP-binding cassette domain-containing protein [Paracoccaceae bacterium]